MRRGLYCGATGLQLFVNSILLAAAITFLTPQSGGQAIGPQPIEITTTIAGVDRVEFYVDGALAGVARKPPYRIAHDFGTSLAAHEVAAKVYADGYRTTTTASVFTAAITAGETMNVDVVEVPMRVRAPRTLSAADLRVTENGLDQSIRDVHAERGPARFVFVVDRSLSMGGGKLEAALRAIGAESKLLRTDDRKEIVLFNHNVMKGPMAGPITPSGGTSLRDAVSSIVTRDRTYAIVITDGGDRNSMTSEEEALRRISTTKMIVDSIILGDHSGFLDKAARNTGGTTAHASASTLQRELHRMLVDINSRYTLVYQSHGNRSGWRTIAIAPRRRGVEIVNARKGYYAE
jgi:Mg-chelatase subunit ChlD